ncbi:MoxR family ATPase [Candidatus Poribacteria bacterium]|nr:MoxR family ATPase [Candidatus Poribacteria bacterium]
MNNYPFDLVQPKREGQLADQSLLKNRPFVKMDQSFQADARKFVPGDQLATAINTAIALGEPLLITGEPGTGKTQAAYYAAYKLNIEPVIHFQVKSDSTAHDLLYHFDTVRYFHDANLPNRSATLDKGKYVEQRALWDAIETAKEKDAPQVLLIDEIDKAPRDFPNDLLHELDKMEFTVTETEQIVRATPDLRPIVFITSNSERRLPEPFLRRCVYHHIRFDDKIVEQAVFARTEEFSPLPAEFLKLAMRCFLHLRERSLRKRPATGELLMWLRVLALTVGTTHEKLKAAVDDFEESLRLKNPSKLPHLGVLLKDHQDLEEIHAENR